MQLVKPINAFMQLDQPIYVDEAEQDPQLSGTGKMKERIFHRLTLPALLLMLILFWLSGAKNAISAQAEKAPMQAAAAHVPDLEPGFLRRLFDAVAGDRTRWVDAICTTVAGLDVSGYSLFVRLVYEESVETQPARHFMQYTTNENSLRAYECLGQRGDRANADTQLQLYWIIKSSPQHPPADPYKWLEKAVEGRQPMAQYVMSELILAHHKRNGGVSPTRPPQVARYDSVEKYRELLSSAANAGVTQAQFSFALFYLGRFNNVFGDIPVGADAAIKWLREIVKQPQVDALTRNRALAQLGHLYFDGKYVRQDYKEAFRWYKQVDEGAMKPCSEISIVRFNLIQMYREGLGVSRDHDKANELSKIPTYCV